MKHVKKSLLFFAVISMSISSCRKNIEKGQLIQASGFVYDSVKNKKIVNAKVYLFGGENSFYGWGASPVDSSISDNNGKFTIQYIAQGNYKDYMLSLSMHGYGIYTYPDAIAVPDYKKWFYDFKYSTELTNIVLSGRELDRGTVKLKVFSNPYDTLYVWVTSQYYEVENDFRFTGNAVDTILNIGSLQNSNHYIRYLILNKQLSDSGFSRQLRDSFFVPTNGILNVNKTFLTTYQIPLKN